MALGGLATATRGHSSCSGSSQWPLSRPVLEAVSRLSADPEQLRGLWFLAAALADFLSGARGSSADGKEVA